MNRVLAALAGLILLTGCTGTPAATLPVKTLPPTSAPTVTMTDTDVKVKLHIESDQPAIIRYSDGMTTHVKEMPLEGNGDAGTMEIAFDAPQPYIAVATITTDKPGRLTCDMTTVGAVIDYGVPGDMSTVESGTFAMCRVITNDPGKPSPTDRSVQLKTKTSSSTDWTGWAGSSSAGEAMTDGTNTTEVSQAEGPVRLIAVVAERGDKVSCRIVDGEDANEETSDDYGDIVTCTRTIRG